MQENGKNCLFFPKVSANAEKSFSALTNPIFCRPRGTEINIFAVSHWEIYEERKASPSSGKDEEEDDGRRLLKSFEDFRLLGFWPQSILAKRQLTDGGDGDLMGR